MRNLSKTELISENELLKRKVAMLEVDKIELELKLNEINKLEIELINLREENEKLKIENECLKIRIKK